MQRKDNNVQLKKCTKEPESIEVYDIAKLCLMRRALIQAKEDLKQEMIQSDQLTLLGDTEKVEAKPLNRNRQLTPKRKRNCQNRSVKRRKE